MIVSENTTTNLPISNGKLAMWLFLATEVMFFTGLLATCMLLKESAPIPGAGIPYWPNQKTVHVEPWLGAVNTVILICSSLAVLLSINALKAHKISSSLFFLGTSLILGTVFLGVKAFEYKGKFAHGIIPGKIGECLPGMSVQREKLLQQNGLAYVRKVQTQLRIICVGVTNDNLKDQSDIIKNAYGLYLLTLDGKDSQNDYMRPLSPAQLGEKVNLLLAEYPQLHLPPAIPNGNLWASCYFALTGVHAIHVLFGLAFMLGIFVKGLFGNLQSMEGTLEVTGLYWHFVDLVWLVLYPIIYFL